MKYFHPKKYWRLMKEYLYRFFWFYLIPDTWEITYRFYKYVGYKPNLQQPSRVLTSLAVLYLIFRLQ